MTFPELSESESINKSACKFLIRMLEVLTEMEVDIAQYMREGLRGLLRLLKVENELELLVMVGLLHNNIWLILIIIYIINSI